MPVTLQENTAIIAGGNEFTRSQIEGRLRTRLEDSLGAIFDRQVRIAVTVDPELGGTPSGELPLPPDDTLTDSYLRPYNDLSTNRLSDSSPPSYVDSELVPSGLGARDSIPPPLPIGSGSALETRLNPKYIFETFVIGSSNRFAHAAAIAVAESPGKSYNPLTIYGESGLGKTHLLHALGHYVRNYAAHLRVRYVSTEELTNDFINAISQNKGAEFRQRYRDVDVLLIDDIQFLEGKEQTQEEFFHTFNTLHNAEKQIVMTSDRPPKLLENLEP